MQAHAAPTGGLRPIGAMSAVPHKMQADAMSPYGCRILRLRGAGGSQSSYHRSLPSKTLDDRAAVVKLQAVARGQHVRKPVYLGGREYHFEQMLGRSVCVGDICHNSHYHGSHLLTLDSHSMQYAWEHKRGYVILARGPDGERVAIKQVIPQSYAGATLSIEAEVRLSNALHKFVATHGHPGGVRLPRFIAHDQYNAAAELVQDAVPLQRYLRARRRRCPSLNHAQGAPLPRSL